MFQKKSRYQNGLPFATAADGTTVFDGRRERVIDVATGIIEHQVVVGDRLDHLARNYYNDDRLWWRIVDANPDIVFAGNLLSEEMAGTAILIPKARE